LCPVFVLSFTGNLQLSITSVHIRYEDAVTHPGHPFAVGITLEAVKGHTVDADGREAFVASNPMDVLRKALKLHRAAIYFDCGQGTSTGTNDLERDAESAAGNGAVLWAPPKAWREMVPVEWEDWFQPGVSALRQERGGTAKDRQYILRPVDGRAFYTRRGGKAARGEGEPVAEAEFQLDVVAISLSRRSFPFYSLELFTMTLFGFC
jgi:vacuolar protein sorting-associated protein 13A/C